MAKDISKVNRIGITGASGFVGQRLLNLLIDKDIELSILSHTSRIKGINLDNKVNIHEGDLSNFDSLLDFVQGCEVVFHLAAYVHKPTVTAEQIGACYEINLEGSKTLIDACIAQEIPPYFVFISTTAVYGKREEDIEESIECNPDSIYGKSKLAAENYLLTKIESGSIDGCILRPCSIIGENAPGNLNRVIKVVKIGFLPVFDGGLNRKSLIYVEDVVRGAMLCVDKMQESSSNIYNLASRHTLQVIEIGKIFADSIENKPIILNLPKKLFLFLANIWDLFAKLTNGKIPYLKRSLNTYCSDDTANGNKIVRELGFETTIPIEEGLKRMAKSYKTRIQEK